MLEHCKNGGDEAITIDPVDCVQSITDMSTLSVSYSQSKKEEWENYNHLTCTKYTHGNARNIQQLFEQLSTANQKECINKTNKLL